MRKPVILFVGAWSLIFAGLPTCVPGQGKSKDPWLIKFENGVSVPKSDFEYVYQKNNGGWDKARKATADEYQAYLDLYINFKRKVMAAEAAKLDTAPEFKAELTKYLKQLAQPYLIERSVLDRMVKEAYDRSGYALRVSHILVSLPEGAAPADTLKAYEKALALRDSVLKDGKDFGAVARRNSDDPSAKQYDGYLSWFNTFDFVYSFEDGAFRTPVGEVSQPVRSKFGYHLIKVHEKKAITGRPQTAHILVRFGPNYEAKTQAEAEARIQEAYARLEAGTAFDEVAGNFSDDPNTKQRGGKLGTKYIGLPPMQDKRYALEPGTYSKPFQTDIGWHIVYVEGLEPRKSFEDQAGQLKNRVSGDPRAKLAEQTLLNNLKKEYGFKLLPENLAKVRAAIRDSFPQALTNQVSLDRTTMELPVFTFAGGQATGDDLLTFARVQRRRGDPEFEPILQAALAELERSVLLKYEETQLPRKYPDYRYLAQEYRDGILLFTLTENKVWRKAVDDTVGLKAYYEAHKADFPAQERVRVKVYRTRAAEAVDTIREFHRALVAAGETNLPDSLDARLRAAKQPVRISSQIVEKADPQAETFYRMQAGELSSPKTEDSYQVLYLVEEFLPAGLKSFDEAKAEVITQYQNFLEQEWLQELAAKYPVEVNKKTLKKLFD